MFGHKRLHLQVLGSSFLNLQLWSFQSDHFLLCYFQRCEVFPKQTVILILLQSEELSERSSFPFFFRSDLQGLGYELGRSKVGKEEAKHSFGGQALARRAGDIRASWCKTGVFLQEFMEGCWTKTGFQPSYGFQLILPLLALTFKLDRNGSEPKKKKKKVNFQTWRFEKKSSRSCVFPWLHLFPDWVEVWSFNTEPGWNRGCMWGVLLAPQASWEPDGPPQGQKRHFLHSSLCQKLQLGFVDAPLPSLPPLVFFFFSCSPPSSFDCERELAH